MVKNHARKIRDQRESLFPTSVLDHHEQRRMELQEKAVKFQELTLQENQRKHTTQQQEVRMSCVHRRHLHKIRSGARQPARPRRARAGGRLAPAAGLLRTVSSGGRAPHRARGPARGRGVRSARGAARRTSRGGVPRPSVPPLAAVAKRAGRAQGPATGRARGGGRGRADRTHGGAMAGRLAARTPGEERGRMHTGESYTVERQVTLYGTKAR